MAADIHWFENMPGSSMIKTISVYLNDVPIEGTHDLYAYKADISSKLQYNTNIQKCQLAAAGYEETLATRQSWTADTVTREFISPLFLDIFCQSKYIIPKVNIKIVLTLAEDKFWTQIGPNCTHPWEFSIEEAILFVRKVQVCPSVKEAHELGLKKRNAIYPIRKTDLFYQTIPTGSKSFRHENIFREQNLKMLIVAMVANDAFIGHYKKDPFEFKPFGLSYMHLTKDGEAIPHSRPFSPSSTYVREYMSMLQAMEFFNKNVSNSISLDEFKTTKCIFVFNLCPDMDMSVGQPRINGNLRLDLQFSTATTEAVNVIFFGICDSSLEIDSARKVHITL